MMKILVVNIHSNSNAGDAVLLQVSLQQLRSLFPGCELMLAMNDPESGQQGEQGDEVVLGSFTSWFKQSVRSGASWQSGALLLAPWMILQSLLAALTYRLWQRPQWIGLTVQQRALLQAYFTADLVVSCPGNFLYSSGLVGLPLVLAFVAMAYGWLVGKPIYMLPQTIGPLRRGWEFGLLRWLLPKVRVVLLRDQGSLALLTKAGIHHPRCYVIPDLAFLYMGDPAEAGQRLLAEYGVDSRTQRPLLGVTLINWGAQNRRFTGQTAYEQAIAQAIAFFIRTYNGTVVLFSQVHGPTDAEDDRVAARRVQGLLADHQEHVIFIDRVVAPAQLQAAYGEMNLLIGTRLHSNIFALTRHIPVVAIAYQPKTYGVMKMLGLENWVLEIEGIEGAQLSQRLQQLWAERTAIRAQLQTLIPQLQTEIGRELARIHHDYQQNS